MLLKLTYIGVNSLMYARGERSRGFKLRAAYLNEPEGGKGNQTLRAQDKFKDYLREHNGAVE